MVKSKDPRLPNRREFNGLCAAFATLAAAPGAWALDAASDAAATGAGRTVTFPDGTVAPALGQGSAGLGKGRHPRAEEEEALRTGLSLGMTLIDTAEIYGSEEFIGRACEASLARLGTDHLDLYLLHWPNGVSDFAGVVTAFENLRSAGKIRAWGVSNFKVGDLE